MKKILLLCFTFLLTFTACSKKIDFVEGEINGVTHLRPSLVSKVFKGIPTGIIAMVKDKNTGEYFGLYTKQEELREGDIGRFYLGNKKFSGSFTDKQVNDDTVTLKPTKFDVYELTSIKYEKRGPELNSFDRMKQLLTVFMLKFYGFVLDKAY